MKFTLMGQLFYCNEDISCHSLLNIIFCLAGQDPLQRQETSFCSEAVISCIQTEVSEMRTKEFVQRRFPFTKWLPQYDFSTLVQDMLAGFTVSLTLIPQSMAYAEVAGLQPQVYILLPSNISEICHYGNIFEIFCIFLFIFSFL
jgi:hypothetical protein